MWDKITIPQVGDVTSPKVDTLENIEFAAFETQILVDISSTKQVLKKPFICSKSSQIYVIIAIDNTVLVFNDNCTQKVYEFKTETNIDCIALSDDSQLLLIAENSGTVHLLHLPSTKMLWSLALIEKCEFQTSFENAFLCTDHEGFLRIYILTTEKVLFCFDNLKISDLYSGITSGNYADILKGVREEIIDLIEQYPSFEVNQIYETHINARPLGLAVEDRQTESSNASYYSVEDVLDGEFHLQLDCEAEFESQDSIPTCQYDYSGIKSGLIKILCTRNCRYILVLDETHYIRVLCVWTKHCLSTYGDGNIHDFVLTETTDSNNSSVTECKIGLLILPKHGDSFDGFHFEIRQFPSFELIYGVRLATFCKLIDCKPNQEYWYTLEADLIKNVFDNSEVVNSLKIKATSESLPTSRLLRLVNKRKYAEAERFAEMFNLGKEVIYQMKIECILRDLSQSDSLPDVKIDSFLNELEVSLAKIKDVTIIQSCLLISLPTIQQMSRFLLFLKQQLENCSHSKEKENSISEINQYISKLLTSEKLTSTYSLMNWKELLSPNLLDYMITKLSCEELDIAFIVWQRHKDEIVSSLSEQKIEQIFEAIPDCMPSSQLISFLCDDFMCTIFPKMPEAVSMTACWLIKRAYLLEITEKDDWPNNAKELLEAFSRVIDVLHETSAKGEMSFSSSSSLGAVYKMTFDSKCVLGALTELKTNLLHLSTLKAEYNCKMSLADYCQEDKLSVLYLLLDRIDLKVMVKGVKNFVEKFALENDLNMELCLEKYIEETLRSSYCSWWYWEEAPWEERLITLVECIHNQNRWMEAVLKIVFHAPIPWSQRIEDLVKTGLTLEHPRSADLKIQQRLLGLKEVLKRYDMRDFPINNDIQLVHTLVNYILKKNRDTAFEDVKKVLSAYKDTLDIEVNIRYLHFFLKENKIDVMIDLLSSFPVEESSGCANRLLRYIITSLDDTFFLKGKRDLVRTMTVAGIRLVRFLNFIKEPVEQERALTLPNLKKLQNEFGFYPTLTEMSSDSYREEILLSSIHSFLSGKGINSEASDDMERKQCGKSKLIYSKIYRLGDCLLLKRETVITYLVFALIKLNKYDCVIELCRELVYIYPTAESAKTLISVVEHFYSNINNIQCLNVNIFDTIYQLLSLVLTYCDKDLLENYSYLWVPTEFLNIINTLCHHRTVLSSMVYTNDVYYNWKFSPDYNDEGFNLELDKVAKCLSIFKPEHFKTLDSSTSASDVNIRSEFINSMQFLIVHLREKGHETTALIASLFLRNFLSCNKQDSFESLNSAMCESLPDIIRCMLQQAIDKRNLDLHFILGLLYSMGEDTGWITLKSLLKWCGSHTRRIRAIGNIGTEYGLMVKNVEATSIFFNLYNRMELMSKQHMPPMSIEVLVSADSSTCCEIVKQIITSPKTDLQTVYLCSEAFNVDSNTVFIEYLNHLLLGSHVKQWTCNLEIPEEEINLVLKKAECVIKDITDPELALNSLKSLLTKVDPYCYEIIYFICEQMSIIAANILTVSSGYFEEHMTLLKFLKVYKRISPPNETEIEMWINFSLEVGDCKLPAISSVRLPFHFLYQDNYSRLINPELSPKTVMIWLKIVPLLKISADDLIMIATKNSVTSYLEKMKLTSYNCCSYDFTYLNMVNNLVKKISDYSKAVACANWVTNKMPPGEYREASAMIAVNCAKEWLEKSHSEIALKTLRKFEYFHLRFAVETVLFKYDLADEKCLAIANKPKQLTEYLVEIYCTSVVSSKNVFQALQEFNEIEMFASNNNLFEVYEAFLSKWLYPPQHLSTRLDETFSHEDFIEETESMDDKNVSRAIYFLLGAPAPVFSSIINYIAQKFHDMTNLQRSRSLFCLLSVTDAEKIATLLNLETENLNDYLVSLMCVAELENLGLSYSTRMFSTCNKLELIEKILSREVKNPKVLIFCVRMNLEYGIWDSRVWNVILERMRSFSMTDQLQNVLQSSQGHLAHIWHSNAFILAWQSVLYSLLRNDSVKSSKELTSQMYRTALRCPCLSYLDIGLLWEEMLYVIPELKVQVKSPVTDACTFILALKDELFGQTFINNDSTMTVNSSHITE